MQGLLKYEYAEPDATGTAHANIDDILAGNKAEHQQEQYDLHGTIGPTPHYQTEEGQQEMFDIAQGMAFPGSGIGASIRGGKAATKFLTGKQPFVDVAILSLSASLLKYK